MPLKDADGEPMKFPEPTLNNREEKLVKAVLAKPNATPRELAKLCGLNMFDVEKALDTPRLRMYLSRKLDDGGATVESAVAAIVDAQKADKVTHYTNYGKVTDSRTEPDHKVRLQAAQLNLALRGYLTQADETHEAKRGVNISVLMAVAKERGLVIDATDAKPAEAVGAEAAAKSPEPF